MSSSVPARVNGLFLWFKYISSQWTEEDEIADYKKNQEWMDECMDGMFEKWYDKIEEEDSMEDRRKVRQYQSVHKKVQKQTREIVLSLSCLGKQMALNT